MEEEIVDSLVGKESTVLIYIDKNGEVIMLTTGDLTTDQALTATKIITVIGECSIVLKLILSIEIFFNKMIIKLKEMFK